jgi:hypothetical protein
VAAGLLTWLGLAKREGDDEPESELVLTIKRGILAARVSDALFLSHPSPHRSLLVVDPPAVVSVGSEKCMMLNVVCRREI